MIREKRTFSGPLLEADFYPVFEDGRKMPSRAPKTKPSTAEQEKYNHAMALKKLIRLINANFDTTDYFMHPTYEAHLAPQDEKAARRDIVNYMRRVKARRDKEAKELEEGLSELKERAEKNPGSKFINNAIKGFESKLAKLRQPFKYAYRIEKQIYKTGVRKGRVNWHFHLFITGGLSARLLEDMWPKGIRVNCNNYRPDKFGPGAAASYMCKEAVGAARFSYSRNLEKPVEKVKTGRICKGSVCKMATQRVDDSEYWEKRYKGYRFVRCYSRYNEYNGHWYVSVVMYRTEDLPPQWDVPDWITEDGV